MEKRKRSVSREGREGGGLVWGRKERKQSLIFQEGAQLPSQEAPGVRVHAARSRVLPTWRSAGTSPPPLGRMKWRRPQSQSTCSPSNRARWARSWGSQRPPCPERATQLGFQSLFALATSPGDHGPEQCWQARPAGTDSKGHRLWESDPSGSVWEAPGHGETSAGKDTCRIAEIQGALKKRETPRGGAAFQSSKSGILGEPERPGPCGGSSENPQDARPCGNAATPPPLCSPHPESPPAFS